MSEITNGYPEGPGNRHSYAESRPPRMPCFLVGEPPSAAPYRSTFNQWYTRAAVRSRPRRILTGGSNGVVYFPPELVPAVSHQLVAERGEETVNAVLVSRLHQYMQFTVELEMVTVVPVAAQIARARSGLEVSAAMRADALKIATDEVWHAQFSFDLMAQVAAATSIEPRWTDDPAFVGRLGRLRSAVAPELHGALGLLEAVVSETLISRILSDLPHEQRLPDAVRQVVADHAYDEGKHHAYFRSLLTVLWPALHCAQRRQLGRLVPRIIWAFLEPDYQAEACALAAVGVMSAQIDQVLAESYLAMPVRLAVAEGARATVEYFRDAGALDDSATREEFAIAGLLDPPPAGSQGNR